MWHWDNAGCVTFATPQSVLLFVLVLEQVLHLRSLQPRQHRAGRQHLTSDLILPETKNVLQIQRLPRPSSVAASVMFSMAAPMDWALHISDTRSSMASG